MSDLHNLILKAEPDRKLPTGTHVYVNQDQRHEPIVVRSLPPSIVLPDELDVVEIRIEPIRFRPIHFTPPMVYGVNDNSPRVRMRHHSQFTGKPMRMNRYQTIS